MAVTSMSCCWIASCQRALTSPPSWPVPRSQRAANPRDHAGTCAGRPRAVEALRSGIAGWIPKEESVEQLLRIISGAMRDEIWLPGHGAGARSSGCSCATTTNGIQAEKHPLGTLTPREREVLAYLAEGIGRRETAERMHLSTHTVRSHLQNLMGKLRRAHHLGGSRGRAPGAGHRSALGSAVSALIADAPAAGIRQLAEDPAGSLSVAHDGDVVDEERLAGGQARG